MQGIHGMWVGMMGGVLIWTIIWISPDRAHE